MKTLIFLLLLISNSYAQCPVVDLGPDIVLNCSDCITVNANYQPAYQTSSYSVSSIAYNPLPYTFGTLYSIPIDDRWSSVLNLPFDFCFFNQVFNQYVISTNGVLSFNTSYATNLSPWAFTASIPTNATFFPRSMIGLYHDIDPSIGGDVRYGIYGNFPCRRLVISFYEVPHFQCNIQKSTFQIILYELTNVIEVHVLKKQTCFSWNGGRACLGIQNNAGTQAAFPVTRNTGLYTLNTPEAWRFTPNGPETSVFNWYNTLNNNVSYYHCYLNDSTLYGQVTYNCGTNQILVFDTINVNLLNTSYILTPIIHN